MHYWRKNHILIGVVNSSLIDLPAMTNLSHMWDFGSLLGLTFSFQLITGVFLAMHYSSSVSLAFNCIDHIMRDVCMGWLLRIVHSNGASMFFLLMFIHISRSLYYNSFILKNTWNTGVIILFLTMAISFLGYVLPWGQMSFWGATVITNLLSAIPFIGQQMVIWLWGGFSVDNATLTRFFSIHFLLPFLLAVLIFMHLVFLHENKSSNPTGLFSSLDKVPFGPYFQVKDFVGAACLIIGFFFFNFVMPYELMDAENFSMANPLVTPPHIQPEWYFLFAYCILRAIPNKLGGVLALLFSILVFFLFSFSSKPTQFKELNFKKLLFFNFVLIFFFLTWLGMMPVEAPFIFLSQIMSFFYFFVILVWLLIYFVNMVLKTWKSIYFYKIKK